ncbi:hypothetical protein AAIR98_001697 [Elusimicrobium simillimum]
MVKDTSLSACTLTSPSSYILNKFLISISAIIKPFC